MSDASPINLNRSSNNSIPFAKKIAIYKALASPKVSLTDKRNILNWLKTKAIITNVMAVYQSLIHAQAIVHIW